MNSFGILKDLIEGYSKDIALNNKLLIALLVFISINLITTIINIISQHRLKSKEKQIISFKIKEEKRILIFETIYQMLDKMTFFMGKDDCDEFLNSIQETEKYISNNKLYLNDKESKVIYEITDYFKTVVSDFRKKDYLKEIMLFNKLSSKFK